MATHTQTFTTDDLDNSADATSHTFSLNGEEWTIDLGQKNADKLSRALAPFIEKATKVGGRRKKASSGGPTADLSAIRAWAAEQGITVSERGRVAKSVIEQYEAAH